MAGLYVDLVDGEIVVDSGSVSLESAERTVEIASLVVHIGIAAMAKVRSSEVAGNSNDRDSHPGYETTLAPFEATR